MRSSFAQIRVERNDHAFAVVQLDADLTSYLGSDLPSIFKVQAPPFNERLAIFLALNWMKKASRSRTHHKVPTP
jgi:hypothetical protein